MKKHLKAKKKPVHPHKKPVHRPPHKHVRKIPVRKPASHKAVHKHKGAAKQGKKVIFKIKRHGTKIVIINGKKVI